MLITKELAAIQNDKAEACAKIAEKVSIPHHKRDYSAGWQDACRYIARLIRDRAKARQETAL